MKRLFMMSLLAVSTVLSAQQSTELKLWPNGAPNTNGITTDEQEPEKNRISNVTVPTLTIYPATQPNGLAIIMCPGGGYTRLAMDHEGHGTMVQYTRYYLCSIKISHAQWTQRYSFK